MNFFVYYKWCKMVSRHAFVIFTNFLLLFPVFEWNVKVGVKKILTFRVIFWHWHANLGSLFLFECSKKMFNWWAMKMQLFHCYPLSKVYQITRSPYLMRSLLEMGIKLRIKKTGKIGYLPATLVDRSLIPTQAWMYISFS